MSVVLIAACIACSAIAFYLFNRATATTVPDKKFATTLVQEWIAQPGWRPLNPNGRFVHPWYSEALEVPKLYAEGKYRDARSLVQELHDRIKARTSTADEFLCRQVVNALLGDSTLMLSLSDEMARYKFSNQAANCFGHWIVNLKEEPGYEHEIALLHVHRAIALLVRASTAEECNAEQTLKSANESFQASLQVLSKNPQWHDQYLHVATTYASVLRAEGRTAEAQALERRTNPPSLSR